MLSSLALAMTRVVDTSPPGVPRLLRLVPDMALGASIASQMRKLVKQTPRERYIYVLASML